MAEATRMTATMDRLRPIAWYLYLVVGLLIVVGYSFLGEGIGRDLVYVGVSLSAAAVMVAGVRIHKPIRRSPWYVMAFGQLLWVVADAIGAWRADVLGIDQFPAPSDAIYLAAYPVFALGLFLLIRGRRPRKDYSGVLDSALVTVALGLISWVLLARPTIDDAAEPLSAAVGAAYPIADILLIGALIRLITTPGGKTPSWRLLLTALTLLIIGDSASVVLNLRTFNSTGVIDFLWLASYVVWGASALHPSMWWLSAPTTDPSIKFSRKRLVALTVAVLVAPITLGVQHLVGARLDVWAVIICSIAAFLLVVARMRLAITLILDANRERTEAQDRLAHQAAHDSLTGLPNRSQAMRLIAGAQSRAQRSGAIIGLLFIDLDGFKQINDTYGHGAGDQVLREVGVRMLAEVRAGDVVARLGGDEFVVLLEPLAEVGSAVTVADRLVEVVSAPITLINGNMVRVGASIGVAISQDAATDPDALLHEADVAVYRAKAAGRGRTEVFDNSLRRELGERAELEAAIVRAIDEDELVLFYQPIIHVVDGSVEGYEALVRWQRPGVGLVPPSEFIPVAEQSDLICDLDTWVLRQATEQLGVWDLEGGG